MSNNIENTGSQESGVRSQEKGTPALSPSVVSAAPWLMFVDVETTGLDWKLHGLLSIGAFHPASGAQFYVECNPGRECFVDEDAMRVNGQDIVEAWARPVGWVGAVRLLFAWIDDVRKATGVDKFVMAGKNPAFDREWIGNGPGFDLSAGFSRRLIDVNSVALAMAEARGIDVMAMRMDAVYEALDLPVEPMPHKAYNGAKYAWLALEKMRGKESGVRSQDLALEKMRGKESGVRSQDLALEWKFDWDKSIWRGSIRWRPETPLFIIEQKEDGEGLILLGAFIPTSDERERVYALENEAKSAALEYFRAWMRDVCTAQRESEK